MLQDRLIQQGYVETVSHGTILITLKNDHNFDKNFVEYSPNF